MRLALCDAKSARLDQLSLCIQTVMADKGMACTVRRYAQTAELLCDIEEGECYDIVFLDASLLARESGTFFETIRQKGCTTPIVLTSAKTSAAVDGYEWGADGFVLYPYDVDRVKRLLTRLLCDTACRALTVHRHRTITRVPFEEILFVESRNTRCIIHCCRGVEYTVYAHLNDIEKRLSDPRFLRCHQSFLVNMDHVVRVDTGFEVSGGAVVTIRQRDLRRIREQYLTYVESKEGMRNMNRV